MNFLRDANDKRELTRIVNALVSQFDNYGRVTLENSTTQTLVLDAKVNAVSEIQLSPRSDAAKSVEYWISDISEGSFVINHASAVTDRTFAYFVFGVQWQ